MPPRTPAVRPGGVTLVELLVTLTVLALLLTAAAPPMARWAANARLRAVSEDLQSGLRLAQAEAVRSNRQAAFVLTNATPALGATPVANGSRWYVRLLALLADDTADDDANLLRTSTQAQQQGMGIEGPAVLCFNSIGRPVSNTSTGLGSDCTAPASNTAPAWYKLTSPRADRRLWIAVSLGGQVRMCDPDQTLSPTTPEGCP